MQSIIVLTPKIPNLLINYSSEYFHIYHSCSMLSMKTPDLCGFIIATACNQIRVLYSRKISDFQNKLNIIGSSFVYYNLTDINH